MRLATLEISRAQLDLAKGERTRALRRLRRARASDVIQRCDRARADTLLAVLTGDPRLLPEADDDDLFRRGAEALLAGEALPPDLLDSDLRTLTLFARHAPPARDARRGR